ncbi:MAG: hypothetical protein ACTSQZ_07230 [Candidatus Thorarchaeota archaeon]
MTSDTMQIRKIGLLILMFIILFALTPFTIEIRDTYSNIRSLFYWIKFTTTGISIDAPFPAGNNAIPSPFLWNNFLQICFVITLLLHYRGITSRHNTLIAGGAGFFIGVLTFIMNGIGTLIGSSLIIIIPVPIPTLVPRPQMELWSEESDDS